MLVEYELEHVGAEGDVCQRHVQSDEMFAGIHLILLELLFNFLEEFGPVPLNETVKLLVEILLNQAQGRCLYKVLRKLYEAINVE